MMGRIDAKKALSACVVILLLALGTGHAALINNNGGGLIYDSAQNITWYDFQTNPMTFAQAQSWATPHRRRGFRLDPSVCRAKPLPGGHHTGQL